MFIRATFPNNILIIVIRYQAPLLGLPQKLDLDLPFVGYYIQKTRYNYCLPYAQMTASHLSDPSELCT